MSSVSSAVLSPGLSAVFSVLSAVLDVATSIVNSVLDVVISILAVSGQRSRRSGQHQLAGAQPQHLAQPPLPRSLTLLLPGSRYPLFALEANVAAPSKMPLIRHRALGASVVVVVITAAVVMAAAPARVGRGLRLMINGRYV